MSYDILSARNSLNYELIGSNLLKKKLNYKKIY